MLSSKSSSVVNELTDILELFYVLFFVVLGSLKLTRLAAELVVDFLYNLIVLSLLFFDFFPSYDSSLVLKELPDVAVFLRLIENLTIF